MKKSIRDAKRIDSLDLPGLGTVTEGLKVKHPVFGYGAVVAIIEFPPYVPSRYSLGVEFEVVGYKVLSPEYAKLVRA